MWNERAAAEECVSRWGVPAMGELLSARDGVTPWALLSNSGARTGEARSNDAYAYMLGVASLTWAVEE